MARKFALKARSSTERIDFSADLNDEQLAVVTAPPGPMLVVAGAGSGKTRALTYRLAWLVHQGIDPSRILLVTFTNRAAREMLHRVALLLKQETRTIWGGTFHHIANRILRQHGNLLGIQPDFTILDREDARDLMASCATESGVDRKERRFPQKGLLVSMSSFVQNTLEPIEMVLAKRYPMFQEEREAIAKVIDLYAQRKRERQLLDYDDLLSAWLVLLTEHAQVRDLLGNQFQHILVDEYQDTNAIQGRIVDLLASKHRNVCVVGDDSQSIYSFRGASFENIIRFKERYPDAREYRLETNYRSTPEILSLANASISRNTRRLPKLLRAVRPPGLKPALVACHDHFVQVRFIAEYILHLMDEGRKLTDIAILYRSHWHSLEIQLELQRRNIPFQVRGGLRFFEQAHIKDVLAWLRLIHNGRDELAWFRVLPLLPRVGLVLSRRLWAHISQHDNPLEAACSKEAKNLLSGGAKDGYTRFVKLLRELLQLRSPAEMIDRIMARFYDDYLVTHYDGASLRREDIKGLTNFAGQYNTVGAFLADVALAGEFSGETVVTGPDEWEFVVLSTVHQAKGLEWPVVFIPWLADGRFPTDMAINTQEELEEERRVFHVAVTRAKDEVYLVFPQIYRTRAQGLVMMKPSRFLTELDSENVVEPMELTEGLSHLTVGRELTDESQTTEARKALPPIEGN
jgi:DNA helicase-2/ATP-dependent DNA helicase PcrA